VYLSWCSHPNQLDHTSLLTAVKATSPGHTMVETTPYTVLTMLLLFWIPVSLAGRTGTGFAGPFVSHQSVQTDNQTPTFAHKSQMPAKVTQSEHGLAEENGIGDQFGEKV